MLNSKLFSICILLGKKWSVLKTKISQREGRQSLPLPFGILVVMHILKTEHSCAKWTVGFCQPSQAPIISQTKHQFHLFFLKDFVMSKKMIKKQWEKKRFLTKCLGAHKNKDWGTVKAFSGNSLQKSVFYPTKHISWVLLANNSQLWYICSLSLSPSHCILPGKHKGFREKWLRTIIKFGFHADPLSYVLWDCTLWVTFYRFSKLFYHFLLCFAKTLTKERKVALLRLPFILNLLWKASIVTSQ